MQNWLLQSGQYHQSLHCGWYQLSSTQCHVNANLTDLAVMQLWASCGWCKWVPLQACMLCSYHYLWSNPHSFFNSAVGFFYLQYIQIDCGTHTLPWRTQWWLYLLHYLYSEFTVLNLTCSLQHFIFFYIAISCFIYRIRDPTVATMKKMFALCRIYMC
jgi:hypothetical protein